MKILICAVTVLAVSTAQAATIHVDIANCASPGDGSVGDPYCSIQIAIENAVDTDEIVVAPGTYFETINFMGKAITLHSSDGPEVTTIDATGLGYSVVTCHSGEGSDTVLEGLKITGGTGTLFEIVPELFFDVGGGMFNVDNSSPTVTNCVFTANHADLGGGMQNWANCNPNLTNCTFSGNTVEVTGGGLYNFDNSSPLVTNCTFSGNDGGMRNSLNCCPTVTDCMFSGNASTGMLNILSCPTVTNCTFSQNSAYRGGGMHNVFNSNPTVTNCTFSGNTAEVAGGGMHNYNSSPLVTNCTFIGNSATNGDTLGFDSPNQGSPSDLTMTNCILPVGGDEIWNNDGSTITISYSDVQGGFPGTGNIDADPMFVDPDNGDYRLSAGSPCIDAGDNTAVPEGVLRDLDGNPRFVADACAGDSGATVDMGAYEFQGTSCDLGTMLEMLAAWGSCSDCGTCPADFDGDCSVGILDLLILLGNWG